MSRIALIHAVYIAIAPIESAFRRVWPEAHVVNLIDDALSQDLERVGTIDERITKRIGGLAGLAVEAGADGVLFTCSAFGSAIEKASARFEVPVLKPNQAMFEAALQMGSRIAMLATFAPAVASMEEEFRAMAAARGMDATLDTYCVPGAMAAAKTGDIALHDQLVADAASRFRDHDAVLLAHFSTSTAKDQVEQALGRDVLTSPDSAVHYLRRKLSS